MSKPVAVLLGLGLALLGAWLALWLNMPLPWLLGPLILTAVTRMSGLQSRCLPEVNKFGRWVIGLSLGLYFSPEVVAHLAHHWPLILFGMSYAMLLAVIGCWVYHRFGGLDLRTAWFAAAIGSASEIANMAERNGARVDQVASAHSMRVLLIVMTVPFAFQWWVGDLPPRPTGRDVDLGGLAVLVPASLAAVWLFQRFRAPNAWMLGALFCAMTLGVMGVRLTAMPEWLSAAGQLAIGWSLGDKYRPDFLRSAPRLLSVVSLLSVVFISVSALIGWGLAVLTGLPPATLILSLIPGGIAEMTITAKVLGLGVPLVTAMQVMRMLAVVFGTEWLYRRFIRPRE